MGDEVAVMSGGRVAQQGEPAELYELPATREVAEFIGDANLRRRDRLGRRGRDAARRRPAPRRAPGAPVEVMIRPERLLVRPGDDGVVERDRVLRARRRLPGRASTRAAWCGRGPSARRPSPPARASRSSSRARRRWPTPPPRRTPFPPGLTATDLLVLGAGPAGVGAAYRAARAGHRVTVLERAGNVGGAAASHEVAGLRVDLGSHRLHPSVEPRILAELRALLGARPADAAPQRPHPPRRPLDRLPAAPARPRPPPAARDGRGRGPRRRPGAAPAPAPRRHLRGGAPGRPRAHHLRALLLPLRAQDLGRSSRRSSRASRPAAASPRARRAGSAARALARGDAGKRSFLYPRRGYGQIWEALADAAAAAGADVVLGAEARRLELSRGGARVTLAGGRALEARRVWSTLPVTSLARMTDPAPPPEALAAAAALEYRAMVLVYLVVAAPAVHALRRALPARRVDAGHPGVRAAQLPRRRRPGRGDGALRRDPLRAGRPPLRGVARRARARRARRPRGGRPTAARGRRRRGGAPAPRLSRAARRRRRRASPRSRPGRPGSPPCSRWAARRCSCTTTPTTPSPWPGPPATAWAGTAPSTTPAGPAPGSASRRTSSRTDALSSRQTAGPTRRR